MTGKRGTRWVWAAACLAAVSACDNAIVEPNLRFAQSGQVAVEVLAPQRGLLADGELRQTLTWRSTGAWQLFESIAYRGRIGAEATTRSPGIPGAFLAAYAELILLVNGKELDLFKGDLNPALDPSCADDETRVTLRIQDEIRREEQSWTRCARGPLAILNPSEAGPEPREAASRLIHAVELIHDFTLGDSATSAFYRSIPFATLDKGARPGELGVVRRVFFGGPGANDEPDEWRDFWRWHAGGAPAPDIDWSMDMVVFAGDGARREAGNTIEVRGIEPVRDGALVRLVEFVPGDFCSPATVVQTPYHVVVAPKTLEHVQFADPIEERVACGL